MERERERKVNNEGRCVNVGIFSDKSSFRFERKEKNSEEVRFRNNITVSGGRKWHD